MSRDEGPVYYREIQKNAYLKRIPNDAGNKLRPLGPLGSKKPSLKPMWTLFCVHNGRFPYLEQYTDPDSPATVTHRPQWRACLNTARHVTASVKPHTGQEYDFLVDCDHGPVRMLAPDWDSMQDWVTTLRTTLHSLSILSRGENVYCLPPVAVPPRAPARDPTSPLPPTPAVPVPRVPGIELTTQAQATITIQQPDPQPVAQEPQPSEVETLTQPQSMTDENVDISNWETTSDTDNNIASNPTSDPNPAQELPSTSESKESKENKTKSVAKICGQNICLDDSILKRRSTERTETTESDEEFFAEIDRINDSVENLQFDEQSDSYKQGYKQTLMVDGEKPTTSDSQNDHHPSNITVITVSNKAPHTAIPVMGTDTNVFDFSFKQHLTVNADNKQHLTVNADNKQHLTVNADNKQHLTVNADNLSKDFVNIVNTEVNLDNQENGYGTVFSNKEPDYGHISLTTTVSLTGNVKDSDGIYEKLCLASTSKETSKTSPLVVKNLRKISLDKSRKSSLPNLDTNNTESAYEYLFPNSQNNTNITLNSTESTILVNSGNNELNAHSVSNVIVSRHGNTSTEQRYITSHAERNASEGTRNGNSSTELQRHIPTSESRTNDVPRPPNSNEIMRQNSQGNVTVSNHSRRLIPVERSDSHNAFDRSRMRELLVRRVQNNSPKREGKSDKPEVQSKPIWKRGLTELSLLSRLRGIGQKRQESPSRRQESPTRQEGDSTVQSPIKVVHRSRPEARDGSRRRSSSLNNQSPPPSHHLQPLRERQAAALRADQRRGATPVRVSKRDPPVFVDYNRQVWVAQWGVGGARIGGGAGDRVACVARVAPLHAAHARNALKHAHSHLVDILFHRVPLGKIYVLNKRDLEPIGIKLDSECNITSIEPGSPASRAGLPPPGHWAVTEVNNRPINLVKGGEEEMNRLSLHGTEASILIQPSPLVKKIRSALKNKTLFR